MVDVMVKLEALLERCCPTWHGFVPLREFGSEVNNMLHLLLYGPQFPTSRKASLDWRAFFEASLSKWTERASRELAFQLLRLIDQVHDQASRFDRVISSADNG